MAVRLNKAILEELQNYINEEEVTKAKRNRIFVGKQLLNNEKELLEIGKLLSNYYQKNNVSAVSPLVSVELNLQHFAADTEGDLEERIKALQQDKEKLDAVIKNQIVTGIPQQVYLDYLVQKRQIMSTLDGMLAQQYAAAKIEEKRENILFQVIDEAQEPTQPYTLKIKIILIGSLLAGLSFGVFCVLFADYWRKNSSQNMLAPAV